VGYIVAGGIKSLLMRFNATRYIVTLLKLACTSTIHTERIVSFPFRRWLRECAAILRCEYIVYLVK